MWISCGGGAHVNLDTSVGDIEKPWHRAFAWAALLLSLVVYPILLTVYQRANSPVFDEGMHIAAGYRYWQCADYGINPEHPPLLKLIAAAPLRKWTIGDYDAPCGTSSTSNARLIAVGYRLLNGPRGDQALAAARTAAMLFPMLLLIVIWAAARAWFGPLAAGFAALLTVFEPNLTAHAPLVATDVAITATALLTVFCADRFLRKLTLARLLWLGLSLGLALASKHTAVFVPFIVLLQFAASFWLDRNFTRQRAAHLFVAWCTACLIAVTVLWGTYQFRYAALPGPNASSFEIAKSVERSGKAGTLFGRSMTQMARFHLLPESYLAGLLYVVNNSTRASFIFGKQYDTGVWFYFPVSIAVKTPLALLALVLLAVASRQLWRLYRREFTTLTIPVVVFLLCAVTSKINLGVRHILPIYPFLILFAAAGAVDLCKRSRAATVLCFGLVLFQAVSYGYNFPNEIAYANEAWGGPKQVHRFLGDSNVDWGQGLYQVKAYADARNITDCWIAWAGPKDPRQVGLPCLALTGPSFVEAAGTELPPLLREKFSGAVFVSNLLTNYDIFPYGYFLKRPPDDVIAGSVLVYHGVFDLPEIAAERRVARGWWYLNHQRAQQALEEFDVAEGHVAAPGILHSLYGWALEASGRPAEARRKYELAAEDYAGRPADAGARKAALERVAALSSTPSH
jgi:4-amino-4-deoxy-L-arabinose transferase-like glycosyltransferase